MTGSPSRKNIDYPTGNVPPAGDFSSSRPDARKEIPRVNRFLDLNQAVGIGQSTVNRLRNRQIYETAKINRYIDRCINKLGTIEEDT